MALLPAVYVTIEDQSFALPNPSTGRYGLIIVLSDRGPHNRVVEINSQTDFYLTFGRPNIDRTGQAHYMADKFLQYSNRLLVVRPVLMDSTDETENHSLANVFIKFNAESGSSETMVAGTSGFTFALTTTVVVNAQGYEQFDVGDYIYSSSEAGPFTTAVPPVPRFRKIVSKNYTNSIYSLILDSAYAGTAGVVTSAIRYYPGTTLVSSLATFKFTLDSNIVEATDVTEFNSFNVKDWIYPYNAAYDGSLSRQVVNKIVIPATTTPVAPAKYNLILDEPFKGTTTTTGAYKYVLFEIDAVADLMNPDGGEPTLGITDPDNIWYFYAIGAGSYYNSLYFIGVRNIEYEKTYTSNDEAGTPLYKYAFMDLYLYSQNPDGNSTLLEGPWTVSLIRTTSNGEIVRDIYTGRELYIESVINFNSSYVRCASSQGAELLLNHKSAELLRLALQSLFSDEQVYRTGVLGFNGVMLDEGSDGIQYSSSTGRLNLVADGKMEGLVQRVFGTQLVSTDGSIENLTNTLYPQFNIDYIIAGGYSYNIQNAARQLADIRQDCMVLADTGFNITAAADVAARATKVPWNTWNAMLYTQYQQVFDPFSGKQIWMSPVYHAIERHLFCDSFYWIAEPVAGIEKGAISAPIKLAYRPNIPKMEDLIEVGLNPVIVEPDGVYILTQFTTWKRLSIMRRAHAVKFVHFVRKNLPKLLKDILQRKMTAFWINLANQRVNAFLSKYVEGANGASERYTALTSFSVAVTPDEARSELNIMLTLHPIRAIEAINVHIIVT